MGANFTVTVQLARGANVAGDSGQALVWEYWLLALPVSRSLVSVRGEVALEFCNVAVMLELELVLTLP